MAIFVLQSPLADWSTEMPGATVRWFSTGPMLCALLACASLSPVAAEQADGLSADQMREISQLASTTLETSRLPGLSIAVAKNNRIWSAGFGKADLEQDVPVTAQSRFRTASIAKWFTATAAMRLVEMGKLNLDSEVQQYCPQFPTKPWPMTSRQLLSHLAGVRHNHGQNAEKRDTDTERKRVDELIRLEKTTQYIRYTDVVKPLEAFKNDPLLFPPGTRLQYSSLGYRVLGCVLEGAAQISYRELMRGLVFDPAGMTATTDDDAQSIIPHRVSGYSRGPNNITVRASFRDVSENLPAGGYLSTAEDLARFAMAFHSLKLVAATTRDRMVERPKLNDGTPSPSLFGPAYYGMGIMVDPTDTQPAWFHTGGQSGFSSLLFLFPRNGVVVAIMTNMDNSAVDASLARKIGEIAARQR
jgi:serine beta-lactamase-like protein LACTB